MTSSSSSSSSVSRSLRATAGPQGGGKSEVVPSPDYRIGATLVVTAGVLASQQKFAAAVPIGILGAFLTVQTSRVRFLFGEDALEVVIGEEKTSSGENAFVGGENKWKYDSFINVRKAASTASGSSVSLSLSVSRMCDRVNAWWYGHERIH